MVAGAGGSPTLDGVDLDLAPGQFFALVGANGAGKTTLLRAVLDLLRVSAGRIEIFGVDHRDFRARGRVAFLPERFDPPPFLTGRDILVTLGRLHGCLGHPEAMAAAVAGLELDAAVLDRPVRSYSKGMAQKLGLAATLASGRDLFLLDEPMSGLDPRARFLFTRQLRRLREERGLTLFFNTHLLADVEGLCDRMAILHEGGVIFSGTPAACRRHYGRATLEEACLDALASRR
ncbi:MAG: ABC transporter ATP-binding protein [Magnetococcales bacterium]|nr:ABC transporter ATP-binding protein [Magnetococcales bacterium]